MKQKDWIWPRMFFVYHGADPGRKSILNKSLRRAEVLRLFDKTPPCLVAIEAGPVADLIIAPAGSRHSGTTYG